MAKVFGWIAETAGFLFASSITGVFNWVGKLFAGGMVISIAVIVSIIALLKIKKEG